MGNGYEGYEGSCTENQISVYGLVKPRGSDMIKVKVSGRREFGENYDIKMVWPR